MSTLEARIAAAMEIDFTGDADLVTNRATLAKFGDIVLSQGTGNNQASKVFADQRSLNATTAEDLDLAGGSLPDPVGVALTFATVKALLVRSADANVGVLRVGGDANFVPLFGAAADFIIVNPGGTLLLVAPLTGYTVTGGSGDIIQVENTGASAATYDIIIIGT